MAEKGKKRKLPQGFGAFSRIPVFLAKDCLHKTVNVPGKFWPALARGGEKDKLFRCSVVEVKNDHQFAGRADKMQAVRITVDGSTVATDITGYWMNMLSFSTFKKDHGPHAQQPDSADEDAEPEDGNLGAGGEIDLRDAEKESAGDGSIRSPFWDEFTYTGKTGTYTTGKSKGKAFELWCCDICKAERKIVKGQVSSLVTHLRQKHTAKWQELRMQGTDSRWIETSKGAVPKYSFPESFSNHVAYARFLVEDLVPPHKARRRAKPLRENGRVSETGFRRFLQRIDPRAYPPGRCL